MRTSRADAVVHLHPGALCQVAAWRAGIPRRLGYRSKLLLDLTLTQSQADKRREGRKHEAEYNFDLLAPLGVRCPGVGALRPSVHLAERWRDSLVSRDKERVLESPYVVLNPTAHSTAHRWPAKHFAGLAPEIARSGFGVVLVGESEDDPSAIEIRERLIPPHIPNADFSGRTNLAELGWLLRGAAALVTRNTGTSHLAAAVGCPTVELFGRMEPIYGPGRWRALGNRTAVVETRAEPRRRGESNPAYWRRCYESIDPADVWNALHQLLSGGLDERV